MAVQYAESFTVERHPVVRRGMLQQLPGQDEYGYGDKISTDFMVRFGGKGRAHRVYAICHSNVASYYVLRGGERLLIREVDLH